MSEIRKHEPDPGAPAPGYKDPASSSVARPGRGGIPTSPTLKSKLPRLAREFYQGHATVLWTHTFEQRATGWLSDSFHHIFREILLHACGRYALACPCYVLMPDHWHLVWMGLSLESDQISATAFLRKNLRVALGTACLQDRAHDRVLRVEEWKAEAFQNTCSYVCNNPQRADLTADWRKWPYLDAMISGYPDLDPRQKNFWPDFWKIHHRLVESNADPCALHRQAQDLERCRKAAQGYIAPSNNSAVARPRRGGIQEQR